MKACGSVTVLLGAHKIIVDTGGPADASAITSGNLVSGLRGMLCGVVLGHFLGSTSCPHQSLCHDQRSVRRPELDSWSQTFSLTLPIKQIRKGLVFTGVRKGPGTLSLEPPVLVSPGPPDLLLWGSPGLLILGSTLLLPQYPPELPEDRSNSGRRPDSSDPTTVKLVSLSQLSHQKLRCTW